MKTWNEVKNVDATAGLCRQKRDQSRQKPRWRSLPWPGSQRVITARRTHTVLARIGAATPERDLVGGHTQVDATFHLGVIDAAGNFLPDPEEVQNLGAIWNERNGVMGTRADANVAWVGAPGGTASTLQLNTSYVDDSVFYSGFDR